MAMTTFDELSKELDLPREQRMILQHGLTRLGEEFGGIFSPQTVERYLVESLHALGNARITNFLPLFAERYARDRLWSLAKVEGRIVSEEPTVLFLCVHNAGRSQMAAGWLQHLGEGQVKVMTGGSDPTHTVNPSAVAAMAEVGIDVSQHFPKPWTDEVIRAADVVITMGCGDACPIFPGKRYEDWKLDDPAGKGLEDVRAIRDAIRAQVVQLMASLNVVPAQHSS